MPRPVGTERGIVKFTRKEMEMPSVVAVPRATLEGLKTVIVPPGATREPVETTAVIALAWAVVVITAPVRGLRNARAVNVAAFSAQLQKAAFAAAVPLAELYRPEAKKSFVAGLKARALTSVPVKPVPTGEA